MKIVFTGISAMPYAREYLSNAAATLRQRGHQVFVPHEGATKGATKGATRGGWEPPADPAAANRFDFEATYQALREADLLLAILDEYTVDDAVAAQIGAFHALAREGERPRRIIGILHDTRVAGWSWSGADRALNPQIRESIHQFGAVYPNFYAALAALETEEAPA